MDDPTTAGVTEGFGLMFYNARWYDPALGRFAQADTIVPAGVQGLDRYAYVGNSPINYNDPSGHCAANGDDWCYHKDQNGACSISVSCYFARQKYVQAGINYQKKHGFASWPFSLEEKDDEFDSVGPAQVSDWEMEHDYGEFTDEGGHEKTGLGLRDGPCEAGCFEDQMNEDIAEHAMSLRLTLRLDICKANNCTDADMDIVAAFSIDEAISPKTLEFAFTPKYELNDPTTGTSVDWDKFISDHMGNYNQNKRLIERFHNLLE
jgi:RHS repeat-associated protein